MISPDDRSVGVLDEARRELGLSVGELWWRFFAVGGMATAPQVAAIFERALLPSREDYDLLAAALNERFAELGRGHPIPYSDDRNAADA